MEVELNQNCHSVIVECRNTSAAANSPQSVAGSPVSTTSSSPKMSLTAASVAAASAAAAATHSYNNQLRISGNAGGGDPNNHNQWEVISSSSCSSTSRQNSMECWDYTIELECLQGPEGGDSFALIVFVLYWWNAICDPSRVTSIRFK